MSNKKNYSTFKKKKPLKIVIADKLVDIHQRNEQLQQKTMSKNFLDIFKD